MPQSIREADAYYAGDWSKWPVPQMPDLPADPWAGVPVFWKQPVTGATVDVARTSRLADVDVPIKATAGDPPWEGTTYGQPYQIVADRGIKTPVWNMGRPITWNWFTPTLPLEQIPFPNTVRREGDPGESSDLHWYGFDPTDQVLYEMIVVTKTSATKLWPSVNRIKSLGTTDWTCGYDGANGLARWDCRKPWNAPGQPRGIVAAGIPSFPLHVRYQEIEAGRINHALFGILPNYDPATVGPARGSDGTCIGHPVRAGERLRLKRAKVESFRPGTRERIIADAGWEYGWLQGDKNSHHPDAGKKGVHFGTFPLSQDVRFAGLKFTTMLSDWEVVVAP